MVTEVRATEKTGFWSSLQFIVKATLPPPPHSTLLPLRSIFRTRSFPFLSPAPFPETPAQMCLFVTGRGTPIGNMRKTEVPSSCFRGRCSQRSSLGKQRWACQRSRRNSRRTYGTGTKEGELRGRGVVKKQLPWIPFRAGEIWVTLNAFSQKTDEDCPIACCFLWYFSSLSEFLDGDRVK